MFWDRERLAAIIAPTLIFMSGFLNFILFHDYELVAPELLMSFGFITGASLILGVLLALCRAEGLRNSGLIVLLLLFLDTHFQFIDYILALSQRLDSPFFQFLVLFLGLAFVGVLANALRLCRHLALILTAVFGVVLIATVAVPPEPQRAGAMSTPPIDSQTRDLPTIVHIVLDGHIGIEGMPQELPGSEKLKAEIENFYLSRGFRLFGQSFSEYFYTLQSLATIMNPETQDVQKLLTQSGTSSWVINTNQYFTAYSKLGYKIRSYQSYYLSFCNHANSSVEFCYRYSTAGISMLPNMEISNIQKSNFIISAFFSRSYIYTIGESFYFVFRRFVSKFGFRLDPAFFFNAAWKSSGMQAVDSVRQLRKDILADPRGKLFFAHLLLPHEPFFLTPDCQPSPDFASWSGRKPKNSPRTERYRRHAYSAYFDQVRCTLRLVADIIDTIELAGIMDDTTIIIHGDHGSRITLADPVYERRSELTARDLIDSFSTLFAIRSPRLESGYDRRMASTQELLREFLFDVQGSNAGDNMIHLFSQHDNTRTTPILMPEMGMPFTPSSDRARTDD